MKICAKVSFVSFIALFIVMMPSVSKADHDCIEEIDNGNLIKVTKQFPEKWFLVGGHRISDKTFHSELKKKFKKNYSESYNEGYTGFFCALKNGVYLSISNGDFGSWTEFSTLPAKCWKCNKISVDIGYLVSGTGLALEISKEEASHIIGYKINADITSIVFEEIEKAQNSRIQHSQTLRLVFRKNKLICFNISENREVYD